MAILQGSSPNLQGGGMSTGSSLQPAQQPMRPPAPTQALQPAAPAGAVQQASGIAPARPQGTDLSQNYANVGGTIYYKPQNLAFSNPNDFYSHVQQTTGQNINSFNGLNFDTSWKPQTGQAPAPTQTSPQQNYSPAPVQAATQQTTPAPLPQQTTSPNTPDTGSSQNSQLQALLNLYNGTLTPSQDEVGTQKQLNDLISGEQLGLNNIEGQAIPMTFIAGQQQGLIRQASAQSLPLTQKLALLQSQRQAASDVAKSELGYAETQQSLNAPTETQKDYNFAKQNGFGGSYTDFLKAQSLLSPTNSLYQSLGVLPGVNSDGSISAAQQNPTSTSSSGSPSGSGSSSTLTSNSTLSNLLGNYVNGDASQPASYQNGVIQSLQSMGVNVDANTPISQLGQFLPQLSQAVAKNEGFGAANNINTSHPSLNNPGSLEFANQPGATPVQIKGADGKVRTFAQFPSLNAGYQALQSQLGLDISRAGSTQSSAASNFKNNVSSYISQTGFLPSKGQIPGLALWNGQGNLAQTQAQNTANSANLTQADQYNTQVTRSVQNAEASFNQVMTLAQNAGINDSSSPLANQISNMFSQQVITDPQRQAFLAGLQEVANEYSQVFSRGGQVTDSVRNQAANIANGNISLAGLQAINDELQAVGGIVQQGGQNAVNNINQQYIGGTQSAPSGQQSQISVSQSDPLGLRS